MYACGWTSELKSACYSSYPHFACYSRYLISFHFRTKCVYDMSQSFSDFWHTSFTLVHFFWPFFNFYFSLKPLINCHPFYLFLHNSPICLFINKNKKNTRLFFFFALQVLSKTQLQNFVRKIPYSHICPLSAKARSLIILSVSTAIVVFGQAETVKYGKEDDQIFGRLDGGCSCPFDIPH